MLAIWIPWSEIEDYEADGWTLNEIIGDPVTHDIYSALMVKDA